MSDERYEPGIYVMRCKSPLPPTAKVKPFLMERRDGRWHMFGCEGAESDERIGDSGLYEILAGPIPMGRIRAANDMYLAFKKVMQWVNSHPRKATICRDVIAEANAALEKADAKE